MECIRCSLACRIILFSGKILCLAKSGAVCAWNEEFVTILIAFFCILKIFSRSWLDEQLVMSGQ